MTESWRRKTYYGKRVLIDTTRVLNPQFPTIIACFDGAELEMLRNLTKYLHRRSTFAEDLTKSGYLSPSNADWDTIESLVATLERKLMGGECEDLITAIESQTAVITAMMQCVCQTTEWQQRQAAALPAMDGYVNETLVTYKNPYDSWITPTPPATDPVKCEYAQSVYLWVYQSYTETLLPFANTTADSIVAAIVATTAFAGFVTFVGIPMALLTSLVTVSIGWAIDGSIENFTNWLFYAKDEIVCIYYNAFPDYEAASVAVKAFIDTQGELSFLDKAMAKQLFGSEWHMRWIIADQVANGTWDTYFDVGQCDTCVPADPECNLPTCLPTDWTEQFPGASLQCSSGNPYTQSGYIIHEAAGVVQPAANFNLVIQWRAVGGAGSAILGVNLISADTAWQIIGGNTLPLLIGQTREDTFLLASPGTIGEVLKLQAVQGTWYGAIVRYCIRPIP